MPELSQGRAGQGPSMKTTTQRVYTKNMNTINEWIFRLGLVSFAELIDEIIIHVDRHQKEKLYDKLSPIVNVPPKPLSGCKIDKKRICIQKNSTP